MCVCVRERERERERERSPAKKRESKEKGTRATVTIFFYPFLDHVTKNRMRDIQTDQSADYSFTHCTKGVTISRPPIYTHLGLQALISISTHVPSGMPDGPFVTQDRFGTGKQKSLIWQGTMAREVQCNVGLNVSNVHIKMCLCETHCPNLKCCCVVIEY